MPLISVVVPTHNRPEMLAEALASVKAQTFTDYEIIVISNGESFELREQSRAIAVQYDAFWLALEKGNVSAARNFGIELAQGDWIAFLDDDDLWLPEKLGRQFAEAERTDADMIASDYVNFFLDGTESIGRPRPPQGWSQLKAISCTHWGCIPSTVIARKGAIQKAGFFDPQQRYCEDNDLWRRIVLHGGRIHHVEEVLTRYRGGHAQLTSPRTARTRFLYDMRFRVKAWIDTPAHLRSELPRFPCSLTQVIETFAPSFLLAALHAYRPRTRLLALRRAVIGQ
jgi:glycosyltransferase involved in cell wall biosynthesis